VEPELKVSKELAWISWFILKKERFRMKPTIGKDFLDFWLHWRLKLLFQAVSVLSKRRHSGHYTHAYQLQQTT